MLRREPRGTRIVYGVTICNSLDVLLRGQLAYMTTHGWEVWAVSSPGDTAAKVVRREGIHRFVPLAMTRRISPVQDLWGLVRWVVFLGRIRPAVVNASTPKAGLLGMVASWLLRVPTRVYVVRGARYETASGVSRQVLVWLERIAVRCSTHTVVISASLREELRSAGIGRRRPLHLIGQGSSNGIPTQALRERHTDAQRDVRRHSDQFTILFLGRFARDKGVLVLAEALGSSELADVHLVTAGDQEEDLVSPWLERLEGSGMWTRFHFVQDIAALFASVDLLVLPSYREGMGNVVLEASAVGLPVIGTTATGLRDAVVDGVTGVTVDPGDAEGLRAAIRVMRDSPDLRRQMGNAGREWVAAHFDQQGIWSALNHLYREGAPDGGSEDIPIARPER